MRVFVRRGAPVAAAALAAMLAAMLATGLTACGDETGMVNTPAPVAEARRTSGDFPAYGGLAAEAAMGARLFAQARCAECHSDVGVILGPGTGNVDKIAIAIRDGRPDAGMPAYAGRLTDAQIWQIAAFVQALDGRSDSEIVEDLDLTAAR